MSLALYFVVVFVIAVPLALFEDWGITHYGVGWGEPLPPDKPWAKNIIIKTPFNAVGWQLLTRYHFCTYLMIVPAAVAVLRYVLESRIQHMAVNWIGWLTFMIAGTMGVMALEDFLFFVFSTVIGKPYPGALARVFRGEAIWHGQLDLGFTRFPALYVVLPAVITIVLSFGFRFGVR